MTFAADLQRKAAAHYLLTKQREAQEPEVVPACPIPMRAMAVPGLPVPKNVRWYHWTASMYPWHGDHVLAHLDKIAQMGCGGILVVTDGNGKPGWGDSGLQICKEIQARGMIAVPRFFVPPNHRWTDANSWAVQYYLENGINIFQTTNEPDLALEWGGHLPPDWLEQSWMYWIEHAQQIIARGGIPLSPPMASGVFTPGRDAGYWDPQTNPFLWNQQHGVTNFVAGVHAYMLNHPWDYPDDDVNQAGQPLTQEEYDWASGNGQYPLAWDGQDIDYINMVRERDKNPGDTLWQDDACLRAIENYVQLLDHAGFEDIKILSAEGGPVYDDRQDGRYPRNTPPVVEWMMQEKVNYLVDTHLGRVIGDAQWLYANYAIGGTGGWMTNQHFWPGGPYSDSDGYVPQVAYYVGHHSDGSFDTVEPPPPPPPPPDPEPPLPIPEEKPRVNEIEHMGVAIQLAEVESGEGYWRCIHVRMLTACENRGGHHAFIRAFRDGARYYARLR
jgi:hypothetical protein